MATKESTTDNTETKKTSSKPRAKKTTKQTSSKKVVSTKASPKVSKKSTPILDSDLDSAHKETVQATTDITVLDPEEAVELNLDLEASIDQLIAEKESIVRPDAIEAKENFDQIQTSQPSSDFKSSSKTTVSIDGFSENVQILTEVFRKSRFDEYLVLLSNPQRVLGINFIIGVFKGMGFAIGLLFVLGLYYYLSKSSFTF
tara:strand:- start:56 stop:658 length:603 start_codon:yes stop_codon:yes gene_type:complete